MAPASSHRPASLGPLRSLLALADVLTALGAGLMASWIAMHLRPAIDGLWPVSNHYLLAIIFGAVLTPGTMNWFGVYRSRRGMPLSSELRPLLLAVFTVFAILGATALATKTTAFYSRTWIGMWVLLSMLSLVGTRMILRRVLGTLHRRGFDTARVALFGGGTLATRVAEHLRRNPDVGLQAAGYFGTSPGEANAGFLPYLGELDALKATLERRDPVIDQLWIVLPLSAEDTIRKVLHELRHSTVDIRMVPDMFSYHLLHYSTESIVGLPVLNLSYSPLSGANHWAKVALDRLLALLILIAIAPLMLLIAVAIRLTSTGPIIFRQIRHGGDGEPFLVYKFRTMYDRRTADRTAHAQARRNDPRVTPLGQFLRRTSLDELPQFLNVLQGTMSIVGPRPHPVTLNDLYCDQVERYMWRHKVKPGITGWAQVNGYRGETDTLEKMRKRVEHDLYYIEHWSLWFDIKIILMTMLYGFTNRNAY